MSKQADHTTLAKYFTIPKDARTILDEIDKQLIKVAESIDEASYGYDGTKEPNANDVKDVIRKLQKIIDKYKGE